MKKLVVLTKRLKEAVELFYNNGGIHLSRQPYIEGYKTAVINEFIRNFPEYRECIRPFERTLSDYYATITDFYAFCTFILELCEVENSLVQNKESGKIFIGAEEKLKESGNLFDQIVSEKVKISHFGPVLESCNCAIELILKDKLNIPTTIGKIDTGIIIDRLIKDRVYPDISSFLNEAKNKVCILANQVKHKGYGPQKVEAINALKVTQDLLLKIKDKEDLSPETKNKLYEIIKLEN